MDKHIVENELNMETLLELINSLNDPIRQQIVMLFITQKEYCVNDIAQHFKISRPTVSHHLILMKKAKLLSSRKEGKEVFYSLNKDFVINTLELWVNLLKNCC